MLYDQEIKMGIIHSTRRFLGGSSKRLPKIFTFFHTIIYKAVNGLLRKVRSIFYLPRSRETSDPLLPIQNPALLTCETKPNTLASVADLLDTNDVQELQCHDIDVSGNLKQTDHDQIIISLPDLTDSFACTTSTAGVDPKNVPLLEEGKEEKVMIKSINVVRDIDGIRWMKHYNSSHRILLVGDGDFSFSASLALAFGSASNIISTSLDSKTFLKKNYWNARSNIVELRSRRCQVMHEIDATVMANHEFLGSINFDRIIFNFPFAGFFKNLSRESQLRRHRRLVSLFLKNAKQMLCANGEIHISHKTNGFHLEWKLESVASSHRLRLIEAVDFNLDDYPGYNTKRGFGGDDSFNCDPSKTYKFGLKS